VEDKMKTNMVLVMCFLGVSAQAAWVEVARNGQVALLQDPDADRAQAPVVQTREMRNYLQPTTFFTGATLGSELIERRYDCAARARSSSRIDLFEAEMGQGKAFDWNVTNDAPWQPVAGEPLGEEGLNAACKRAGLAQ
jgi:hypothetical protein